MSRRIASLAAVTFCTIALVWVPDEVSANMFWKDWNGAAPGGYMPDINQNQDFDGDGTPDQDYCCPTAMADSLRWFDRRADFDPVNWGWSAGIVGAGVTDKQLVQNLAERMDTNGQTSGVAHEGTYWSCNLDLNDQFNGTISYLDSVNLGPNAHVGQNQWFDATFQCRPTFAWVASELQACEDVKLDVAFAALVDVLDGPGEDWQWACGSSHCIAVAGVDADLSQIALSDPDDLVDASGDDWTQYPVYDVHHESGSPCGLWELGGYCDGYATDVWVVEEQCWCTEFLNWRIVPPNYPGAFPTMVDLWAAEVAAAMAVSPIPEPSSLALLILAAGLAARRLR